MDTLLQIVGEPISWGIIGGLVMVFFTWRGGATKISHMKKETKRVQKEMEELQGHLNTQLKINASGNDSLNKELQELKKQNENLRVMNGNLMQKPEKTELKHLHITESAVRMMREQAPGFATAWEKALRNAEEEYESAESGLTKLVRKVLPSYGSAPKALEVSED